MIEIKNFKNFYFEPESENYPDCGDGAHFSLEQIIEDSTLLSNINNVCMYKRGPLFKSIL